ncbi:unnamed protein product [Pylaiella littoralis]
MCKKVVCTSGVAGQTSSDDSASLHRLNEPTSNPKPPAGGEHYTKETAKRFHPDTWCRERERDCCDVLMSVVFNCGVPLWTHASPHLLLSKSRCSDDMFCMVGALPPPKAATRVFAQ